MEDPSDRDLDSYSEVTSQGWGERLLSSIKGIVVGFILIIVAIVLLSWNEGRTADRSKALAQGEQEVISIAAGGVEPKNNGKLVHLSGLATTTEHLSDPDFGLSITALRLERSVEMYQWKEEKKSETRDKIGGGSETVTHYSYKKDWSDHLINSSDFKKPEGHSNPAGFPVSSEDYTAQSATLGAFSLAPSQIAIAGETQTLRLKDVLPHPPAEIASHPVQTLGTETLYLGQAPNSPQIGDLKVRFMAALPATVTVVAQQDGESFRPYQTPYGPLDILHNGQKSIAEIFTQERDDNALWAWVLRAVGFVVMAIGIRLLFAPLEALAAVLPFLKNLVGFGISLISWGISFVLSALTVIIAWLTQRPLLGLLVLSIGVGIGVWGVMQSRKAQPHR